MDELWCWLSTSLKSNDSCTQLSDSAQQVLQAIHNEWQDNYGININDCEQYSNPRHCTPSLMPNSHNENPVSSSNPKIIHQAKPIISEQYDTMSSLNCSTESSQNESTGMCTPNTINSTGTENNYGITSLPLCSKMIRPNYDEEFEMSLNISGIVKNQSGGKNYIHKPSTAVLPVLLSGHVGKATAIKNNIVGLPVPRVRDYLHGSFSNVQKDYGFQHIWVSRDCTNEYSNSRKVDLNIINNEENKNIETLQSSVDKQSDILYSNSYDIFSDSDIPTSHLEIVMQTPHNFTKTNKPPKLCNESSSEYFQDNGSKIKTANMTNKNPLTSDMTVSHKVFLQVQNENKTVSAENNLHYVMDSDQHFKEATQGNRVAIGDVSVEEWEDLNSMIADSDILFQDIPDLLPCADNVGNKEPFIEINEIRSENLLGTGTAANTYVVNGCFDENLSISQDESSSQITSNCNISENLHLNMISKEVCSIKTPNAIEESGNNEVGFMSDALQTGKNLASRRQMKKQPNSKMLKSNRVRSLKEPMKATTPIKNTKITEKRKYSSEHLDEVIGVKKTKGENVFISMKSNKLDKNDNEPLLSKHTIRKPRESKSMKSKTKEVNNVKGIKMDSTTNIQDTKNYTKPTNTKIAFSVKKSDEILDVKKSKGENVLITMKSNEWNKNGNELLLKQTIRKPRESKAMKSNTKELNNFKGIKMDSSTNIHDIKNYTKPTSTNIAFSVKKSELKNTKLKQSVLPFGNTKTPTNPTQFLMKEPFFENRFKKKTSFQAPFRDKSNLMGMESSETNIRNDVSEGVNINIITLDNNSLNTLKQNIKNGKLLEVGLTIIYKEGCCQLNKRVEKNKHVSCSPSGLMVCLTMTDNKTEFFFLQVDMEQLDNIHLQKEFLLIILKNPCRKLCFKAQEILIQLIKFFGFEAKEIHQISAILDSMIACWLLDPDNPRYDFTTIKAMIGTGQENSMSKDPHKRACQLLQQLSHVMELLYKKLHISGLWKLFLNIEMEVVPILATMENRGISADSKQFEGMKILLEKRILVLQESAYKAAGKHFQLNSPLQLRQILYGDLKLDQKHNIKIKETTTVGVKSTSEHMLHLLVPLHPLPAIILEYRHLQKLKSTYVDAVLHHINNGYIFTNWEQISAATGRITSSNPNLQAIPKQAITLPNSSSEDQLQNTTIVTLRSPYQPRPGYSFLAADFQHIELRIFAHLAQDQTLLQVFQQSGDIFLILAKLWLGKSGHMLGVEDREKTKRIVYSVMYGAGAGKLAQFLKINNDEASQIINSFMVHFPTLRNLSNNLVAECRTKGCLRTLSGRRRLFPNICSNNAVLRAHSERQAINFVIQGSAADVCKAYMLHTQGLLTSHPEVEAHLLLQIHDELMWEVRDADVETFKGMIQDIMEDTHNLCKYIGTFSIPLSVAITTGKNWGNMKI